MAPPTSAGGEPGEHRGEGPAAMEVVRPGDADHANPPASMLVIMPYPPEGPGEPQWDAPVCQDGRS